MNNILDYKKIVPQLADDTEFINLENSETLIVQKTYGHRVKINPNTRRLLDFVDGKKSVSEIADAYSSSFGEQISANVVYTILYDKLSHLGIIKNENIEVKQATPKYLRLRMTLIKNRFSRHITKYLCFLCKPKLFYSILILSYIYLCAFSILNFGNIVENLNKLTILELIIVFLVTGLGMFIHEFGHISACDYFGAQHGDIGFGFYLFTPVMYADVTDIWRLPAKNRIEVNLAGMCFGNLFSVLVTVIYFVTGHHIFLYIALMDFIESLYNLNPLVKYDGYWVLSDLTGVPNLHKTSYAKLRNVFQNFRKYGFKDWLLVVYGAVSISFIFVFLFTILVLTPESVLYFPVNVYNYFKNLLLGISDFSFSDLLAFLPPLIFYWLAIRLLLQYLKKRKNKN